MKQKAYDNFCSIIILTYNVLELTKLCIGSIFRNTPYPYELIFVDNGSTDGTVEFLEALVSSQGPEARIKIIKNHKNLGFAKGCNQGIREASGEYILLLNNDTVVTEGWLGDLIDVAESDPDTGIVGPVTRGLLNLADMVEYRSDDVTMESKLNFIRDLNTEPKYSNVEGLDRFAAQVRRLYKGSTLIVDGLTGFCMLIKREVINHVGLFDENFDIGLLEDNDFSWRAKSMGYRPVLALGVFIHHHVSGSFQANKIDMGGLTEKNIRYFEKKLRVNNLEEIDVRVVERDGSGQGDYYKIDSVTIKSLPQERRRAYRVDISYTEKGTGENRYLRDVRIESVDPTNYRLSLPGNPLSLTKLCEKVVWDSLQFKLVNYPLPSCMTVRFGSH